MVAEIITVGATNLAKLTGLYYDDGAGVLYPLDATVLLVGLYDSSDVIVAGTANIAMPYKGGTGKKSVYAGPLVHTIPLVKDATYTAKMLVTIGANVRPFNVPCVAKLG